MMTLPDKERLERRLNSFDSATRRDALAALAAFNESALPAPGGNVNLHCHSFFSYNAFGWSPSRLAWEARKRGFRACGLCDFDVLDGMDEFLAAGHVLGLRTCVHLETRAYVAEQAADDINPPGEPGVTYIMGGGFTSLPEPGSAQATFLESLRQGARDRNEALISRINTALPQIALDYETDILPRTPKGVATERHIVAAYVDKAVAVFPDPAFRTAFWEPLVKKDSAEAMATEASDRPTFEEWARAALSKRGGIGYVPPTSSTFPPVDDFIAWVRACDAIPLVTWLDGTRPGEASADALLDLMTAKGCAGVNIIPDRNWNFSDPAKAGKMAANLDAMVKAADARGLPIVIGTEMNKLGLPIVDDLDGPVLSKYRESFLRGADILVGHTLLSRVAAMPYLGGKAADAFPSVKDRNDFFAAVGALPPVTEELFESLLDIGPERAFTRLADAVRARA